MSRRGDWRMRGRCKNQADRAKTQWEAPYDRAEGEFSGFFSALRDRRPRKSGSVQSVARFSHGLGELCTRHPDPAVIPR